MYNRLRWWRLPVELQLQRRFSFGSSPRRPALVPVAASISPLLRLLFVAAPSRPASPAPPLGIALVGPEHELLRRHGRFFEFVHWECARARRHRGISATIFRSGQPEQALGHSSCRGYLVHSRMIKGPLIQLDWK